MANFAGDGLSWSAFVDAVASPLRLESGPRQAFGLLALLHLVAALWGDIAFWRAAERLVRQHHFNLDAALRAAPSDTERIWFGHFLERIGVPPESLAIDARVPLPAPYLKPASPAGPV